MYVISVPTCLSIFSIVIVTVYLYVFYFVTFLFFLIGNYLHFFNVNTSSNESSIKCIHLTSVFSITAQRKAQ